MIFNNIDISEFNKQSPCYIPGPMDSFADPDALYKAYLKASKPIKYKSSTQRYGLNLLSNIVIANENLNNGTYSIKDPYEFVLTERGRLRYVKALYMFDQVVQRSFNDNVLNPAIYNKLIYDNGACVKGKGVAHTRLRFKLHLQQAYYQFGYSGFIMIIDYSKYFDNILHQKALNQFKPLLTPYEYSFLKLTFDTFKLDVSYMDDEEYLEARDGLINLMDYAALSKDYFTGKRFLDKSVGIGNQTSQGTGIFYPHTIDNYITIVRGYGLYGRHMDDSYIFAQTEEELLQLLSEIDDQCKSLGIHINKRKTRIQPIGTTINYLKLNYKILESGKVLELVPNLVFRREKHKLEKFYGICKEGKMTAIDVLKCFLSWKGIYDKFDSKRKMYALECYFKDLFCFGFRDTDLHELLHFYMDMERKQNELYPMTPKGETFPKRK